MKTIAISVLSAIVVISSVCFSYNCGKHDQELSDYRLYGHYFSERTLEVKSHFDELDISPDSIHYCEKCRQIFIEYPGIERHEHQEQIMRKLVNVYQSIN